MVTIEFLVVCSSTTVGYEWDTSSLGYWFPSALSVYCWWCLGSPEFPNDHQEPWTALSIYPCVQVHEPWKAPLWRMCKHKVEGSLEEGKKLIQTSPKSNIRFPDILPWTSSPYGTSKVTLVSQSILIHVLLSSFHTLMSWLLSNEKIEPPLPSHSRCLQTP